MIDRIKNDTSVFDVIFNSVLSKQKPSHAYLFELYNEDSYSDVYKFIKMLLCPEREKNFISGVCSKCSTCKNIDKNNCLDLKIVLPCNGLIKKEDILNVQKFFATKSLNNEIRVYLIKDCDKMNASASNASVDSDFVIYTYKLSGQSNKTTCTSSCITLKCSGNLDTYVGVGNVGIVKITSQTYSSKTNFYASSYL